MSSSGQRTAATGVRRQRAAIAAGLRTLLREPTTIAMVVVLPPLVIVAFDVTMDAIGDVPGIDLPPGAAELGGALFATAFLAGLLGVFQVVGSSEPDGRLVRCGYRPWEVLLARTFTIVAASSAVALLTFGTFLVRSDVAPEAPVLAIGALVLAAVIYGLIGVLIGALLERELVGSLVLVFFADFDAFASLGVVPIETDLVELLPLARPHDLLSSAVHDGTVAAGDAMVAGAYVLALAGAVIVVVSMRGGSG